MRGQTRDRGASGMSRPAPGAAPGGTPSAGPSQRRGSVAARAARMLGRSKSDGARPYADSRLSTGSWAVDASVRSGWDDMSARSDADDDGAPPAASDLAAAVTAVSAGPS